MFLFFKIYIKSQCLSGTGALRVGAEFLATRLGYDTFYYSQPTWESHPRMFKATKTKFPQISGSFKKNFANTPRPPASRRAAPTATGTQPRRPSI